jgi:hypothetical protein
VSVLGQWTALTLSSSVEQLTCYERNHDMSSKRSWSRSWNPLRKRVALPSVDGVNQFQSSTSVSLLAVPSASNSPSRSVVNFGDSIQARSTATPSALVGSLATSPVNEDAQIVFNGLHELLKVLKESIGFFAPLKAAVDILLSCIEIYKVCGPTELTMRTHISICCQRTSGNHKEMDGLMGNINRLSSILARRLANCQGSLTRQGINDLAKCICMCRLEAQLLILVSTEHWAMN